MAWFFSRRTPERPDEPRPLASGSQRSPGFELVCRRLGRRAPGTILDLGTTSTENLAFLSEMGAEVAIEDAFHSAGGNEGLRAERFSFDTAEDLSLPAGDSRFDLVLLWDLLGFLPKKERPRFGERLAARCHPGAYVLLIASATEVVPPIPIRFRIESEDRLFYSLPDTDRVPSPGLKPRDVETALVGFEPVRVFQLRNGLQEMVFQRRGDAGAGKGGRKGDTPPRPKDSKSKGSKGGGSKVDNSKGDDSKGSSRPKDSASKGADP